MSLLDQDFGKKSEPKKVEPIVIKDYKNDYYTKQFLQQVCIN
jgi:hypothetical protein